MSDSDFFRYFFIKDGYVWGTAGTTVCRIREKDLKAEKIVRIRRVLPGYSSGLLHRFMRQGIHQILPLEGDSFLAVLPGRLAVFEKGKKVAQRTLTHGVRPLPSGIAVLQNRDIVYGDYWGNPKRKPVQIYLSRDCGRNWQVIWSCRPGEARHVHLIQQVQGEKDQVYFSTGDSDRESGLFQLNINSGSVRPVGSGSQSWRMVSLLQQDNLLIWGSDTEGDRNHLYSFDLKSRQLFRGAALPGPAYYSTKKTGGEFIVATTVESPGLHRAGVYAFRDINQIRELCAFVKDPWPSRLFGYGTVEFAADQEQSDRLWINIRGLRPVFSAKNTRIVVGRG